MGFTKIFLWWGDPIAIVFILNSDSIKFIFLANSYNIQFLKLLAGIHKLVELIYRSRKSGNEILQSFLLLLYKFVVDKFHGCSLIFKNFLFLFKFSYT